MIDLQIRLCCFFLTILCMVIGYTIGTEIQPKAIWAKMLKRFIAISIIGCGAIAFNAVFYIGTFA